MEARKLMKIMRKLEKAYDHNPKAKVTRARIMKKALVIGRNLEYYLRS